MLDKVKQKIDNLQLEYLANETNFYLRRPKKITATDFVTTFFSMILIGKFSLKTWASQITNISGVLVSHQGVAKKLGFRKLKFVNKLLETVMTNCLKEHTKFDLASNLKSFSKIYIEDSTCFELPKKLFPFFPGPSSKSKPKQASGKIQLTIDIRNNVYSNLELLSFRDTDAKYSKKILEFLSKGDLVIRDLGYWSSKVLKAIAEKEAFFLSRLKLKVHIFNPDNEEDIDLFTFLKGKDKEGITKVDMSIGIKNNGMICRMVAIRLPEAQAQKRRATAKKNRSSKSRNNIPKETMYLMGWNLLITNVEDDIWTTDEVYSTYSLRWNIEIIFKHWKSNLKLKEFVKTCTGENPARPEILIKLYLIWVILVYVPSFNYYQKKVYTKFAKLLSPAKFADYIKANFNELILKSEGELTRLLMYYCCFDKRKDRDNYFEKTYMLY